MALVPGPIGRGRALLASATGLMLLSTACAPASPSPDDADHSVQVGVPAAVQLDAIVGCLADQGWEVEVDRAAGSFEYAGAESGVEDYQADLTRCSQKYSVPRGLRSVSRDDAVRLRLGEITAAACLRGRGFDVPDPPDLETYLDEVDAGTAWEAHAYVVVDSVSRWDEVLRECPRPAIG